MTSNSSPGDDTTVGHPLGGYILVGPVPPGMGGTPLKPNKLPWQTGGQPGGMPLNQKKQPWQQMPGASKQQGSSSGAVTTGFGLKNSPFGKPGGMPGTPGFSDPNPSKVNSPVYPFPNSSWAGMDYRHRKNNSDSGGQQGGQQGGYNSLLRKKFGL